MTSLADELGLDTEVWVKLKDGRAAGSLVPRAMLTDPPALAAFMQRLLARAEQPKNPRPHGGSTNG